MMSHPLECSVAKLKAVNVFGKNVGLVEISEKNDFLNFNRDFRANKAF